MSRRETLYRIMYQNFTPGMMRLTPMWVKRRIANALEYQLVDRLAANDWLMNLLQAKPGELAPISIEMFDSCVGGSSLRPFFSLRMYWRWAGRIISSRKRTPAEEQRLKSLSTPPQIAYPPGVFPAPRMRQRGRLP